VVRHVRYARVNDVPCIPPVRLRPVRVLWVLVRGFRLRDQRGPVLVRELRHVDPVSAMFRAA
jgi:hypothetical protein